MKLQYFQASILSLLLVCLLQIRIISAATAEQWRDRSIYQILTDRFATSDGSKPSCFNIFSYCGGTFKGIMKNLDYITGMGFNAIWISPVVENSWFGYHGYWAHDFYKINSKFGTEQDLINLVKKCHEKDIYVMVDVVVNHVGPSALSIRSSKPFNKDSHFHDKCHIRDWNDVWQLHNCRLSNLPDLKQEDPFVKKALIDWIKYMIKKYQFDGMRLDAAVHVPHDFWREFNPSAGIFSMGEVLSSNYQLLTSYQGPIDGILNYPLYYEIKSTFGERQSMRKLEHYFEQVQGMWRDPTLNGNFVGNHDQPRFLQFFHSKSAFKAAIALSLTVTGIPVLYYGDEQMFIGSKKKYFFPEQSRDPLWKNMDQSHEMYQYIKTIMNFRQQTNYHRQWQVQRFADDNVYAFSRGNYFFAFTNSEATQQRTISFHPYDEGTLLCNLFHSDDCVRVEHGKFQLFLLHGETKIFYPVYDKEKIEKYVHKAKQDLSIKFPVKTPSQGFFSMLLGGCGGER